MVVPSMTRKEVALHLLSEARKNKKRLESKVGIVAKLMRKLKVKFHNYQQLVGNNTLFTVYIYGIDDTGVDYAAGIWYRSELGLCWVTSGALDQVVFFTDHFFDRYAERYLHEAMTAQQAASKFYKVFKVSIARHTEEIAEKVYRIQLPLAVGGLALGFHDRNNDIAVYNTYVSSNLLHDEQQANIEADKDLNELLQKMNHAGWTQVGKALR